MAKFFSTALLLLLSTIAAAAAVTPNDKVHDTLPDFGLPRGLLPNSVVSYTFSPDSGEFSIELAAPCYVHFSHLAYYEKRVSGKLSYGEITNIKGVQAKKLFVWVSITGMVAHEDEGVIEFQSGFLSESLSIKEFEKVPDCKKKIGAGGRSCGGAAGLVSEATPAISEE